MIASHLSNEKRIGHLFECLQSLLNQTIVLPIYLSISFETHALHRQFSQHFSHHTSFHTPILSVLVQTTKTPQMRHMAQLIPHLLANHTWIMFCDDDDIYDKSRTQIFEQTLAQCKHEQETLYPTKQFAGIYESTFGKNHREQRHEFWCYFVQIRILAAFLEKVTPYPDVLDHRCCDVFFGEYLRRLHSDYLFGTVTVPLYHYRVADNSDSVTGVIQAKHRSVRKPLEITYKTIEACAADLNAYLDAELDIYIHDTYLRTIVGNDFETILKSEFKNEIQVLHLINPKHLTRLLDYHQQLRALCNDIYDIKV
jgi:hypothetical protein